MGALKGAVVAGADVKNPIDVLLVAFGLKTFAAGFKVPLTGANAETGGEAAKAEGT